MSSDQRRRAGDNVIPLPPRNPVGGAGGPPITRGADGTVAVTRSPQPGPRRGPPAITSSAVHPRPLAAGSGCRDAPDRAAPHARRLTLHVDLDNSYPPVWRRVEVHSDMRLDQLHDVIVAVMGWEDIHLHAFYLHGPSHGAAPLPLLMSDADLDAHDGRLDEPGAGWLVREVVNGSMHESEVLIGDVLTEEGQSFRYDYDMGAAWRHTITLETSAPATPDVSRPSLRGGARSCPPEDCGGIWLYNDIVLALEGDVGGTIQSNLEDVEDQLDWLPENFDPARFDECGTRARLAGVELADLPPPMPPAEAVVPELGVLIDACGSRARRSLAHLLAGAHLDAGALVAEYAAHLAGTLTSVEKALDSAGGRRGVLPTELTDEACAPMVEPFADLLRAAIDPQPWTQDPGARHLGSPVHADRELLAAAKALGLIRVENGSVHPADDLPALETPRDLADHIARHLPLPGAPNENDAGVLALLAAGAGTPSAVFTGPLPAHAERQADLARRCLEVALGLGWGTERGELTDAALAFWGGRTWSVLSLLCGGSGVAERLPGNTPDAFPAGTVPDAVAQLARAALRMA